MTRVSKPLHPYSKECTPQEYLIYATPRLEGTLLNFLVLLDGGRLPAQQIYSIPGEDIQVVPQ